MWRRKKSRLEHAGRFLRLTLLVVLSGAVLADGAHAQQGVRILAPAAGVQQTGAQSRDWKKIFSRAEAGDAEAMMVIADAYAAGGQGLKKSLAKAAVWYRRAAQAGNVQAMKRLAHILLKGGEGVRRAPKVAAALLLEAAQRGDPEAMYRFAWMMEKGRGVPPDMKLALEWYQKAAEAGHAPAQVALGLMYLTGRGVERDFEMARSWLEKAAEQGDPWGLNDLGVLYEEGWGVAQDKGEAIGLYRKAAELGNPAAMRNLVRLGMADPKEPSFYRARDAVSGWHELAAGENEDSADEVEEVAEASGQLVPRPAEERKSQPRRRYNFTAGRLAR